MSDVIDKDLLMANIDGDMEFLAEAVEMFDEDGSILISRMHQAISDGGPERLLVAAHTYKSMVGNFCAEAAQQAAFKLEMMGRHAELGGAEEALCELEAQAARLRAALDDVLKDGMP
jgi:HPt (histidine-containing phosphotransfer) domain-containing protein